MNLFKKLGFKAEPVVWSAFLTAVFMVLVEFGVDINSRRQAALNALLLAGFALFARHNVASPETVKEASALSMKEFKNVADDKSAILVEKTITPRGDIV